MISIKNLFMIIFILDLSTVADIVLTSPTTCMTGYDLGLDFLSIKSGLGSLL